MRTRTFIRVKRPPAAAVQTLSEIQQHTMGLSLWHYGGSVESPSATSTDFTGVAACLVRLCEASGTSYGGSLTFGFMSQHVAQSWPSINYSGRWYTTGDDPSPTDTFAGQSYTHGVIMPSNFLAADMGEAPLYDDPVTTFQGDFETIFDNMRTSYPSMEITLFVHEPDAGQWAGGANMNASQRSNYNAAISGAYLDWFKSAQNAIEGGGRTIRTAPVGPIIADLWENESYMSTLEFNEMYGDDAPHGTENNYLLKALVMYQFWYRQNPNVASLNTTGFTQLSAEITDNLASIVSYIEQRLNYYNSNGVTVYL